MEKGKSGQVRVRFVVHLLHSCIKCCCLNQADLHQVLVAVLTLVGASYMVYNLPSYPSLIYQEHILIEKDEYHLMFSFHFVERSSNPQDPS